MDIESRRSSSGSQLKSGLVVIIGFIALLWGIEIVNLAMEHDLCKWGIQPRTRAGLVGIVASPFIHGSVHHLILNTLPLLILSALVMVQGRSRFISASWIIIILGGAGVWIFGRTASHVGASGLIFGYFGFLVSYGWYRRSLGSIVLAVVAVALYGGMIWGILPVRGHVSWEGHLFGALAGVVAGHVLSRKKSRR